MEHGLFQTAFTHPIMSTAFLYSPQFLEHRQRPHHPERPERLEAIVKAIKEVGLWERLDHRSFEAASELDLAACHTLAHIERVKEMAERGGGDLDGDTHVSPVSFEVARLAVGAAIEACRAVLAGEAKNAFVACRPCGHHAESGRDPYSPWGFCLFNNVAVAARVAQRDFGAKKIAILDFDVHHGNGTQEIFYADGSVLFISLHQSPLFPGTGETSERGIDEGEGTTLNYPLPRGSSGAIYHRVWGQVGNKVRQFAPDLIILSAGYDAHEDDPLAGMNLQADDFAALVWDAQSWANELCGGKLVAILEGGYNLDALAAGVVMTLGVLSGSIEEELHE